MSCQHKHNKRHMRTLHPTRNPARCAQCALDERTVPAARPPAWYCATVEPTSPTAAPSTITSNFVSSEETSTCHSSLMCEVFSGAAHSVAAGHLPATCTALPDVCG
jgi:hypothetical protein